MGFNSIVKGLNGYKKLIPLKDGVGPNLHYYCNITLNYENEMFVKEKRDIGPFKNYEDYERRLLKVFKKLILNAQSPQRKTKYGLVTTISSGYDAAASAAIAKELGCNTAVTFDRPGKYTRDNGVGIAKVLGYKNIVTKNANDYL